MEAAQSPEEETEEGVVLARKNKRKIELAPDTILVVVVCASCIAYLILS
jgi:hypothetical protein